MTVPWSIVVGALSWDGVLGIAGWLVIYAYQVGSKRLTAAWASTNGMARAVWARYILEKGDFEVHTICQPCENHLQKHLHSSCIELNRLSPVAIKAIGKARIETVESLRARGLRHIYYNILPDCPSRHTLISLIPQNCAPYLSVFPDSTGARVSLADLCELQTSFPQRALEQVVRLLANHTFNCHHCTKVERRCSAGGYCAFRRKGASRASTHTPPPCTPSAASPDATSAFGDESGNYEYESLGYHSFNLQQGAPLPPNAKMKLCRTCSEYCHTTCYMVEEAQCAGCVH